MQPALNRLVVAAKYSIHLGMSKRFLITNLIHSFDDGCTSTENLAHPWQGFPPKCPPGWRPDEIWLL